MDLITWFWVWDERFINLLVPYFTCIIPKHKHKRVVAVWLLPLITSSTFVVLSILQYKKNMEFLRNR